MRVDRTCARPDCDRGLSTWAPPAQRYCSHRCAGLAQPWARPDPELRTCAREGCGIVFPVRHDTRRRRHCSRRCANVARIGRGPEERFWEKVDRTGGPHACWLWLGARVKDRHGRPTYGMFAIEPGCVVGAHRYAYELAHGPGSADGWCVLHNCPWGDNQGCVNFAHLWRGTVADNNADMWAKGRGRGRPRLTRTASRDYWEQSAERLKDLRPDWPDSVM